MIADRARPPARRARGRADPRGNRAACRGLRGRARGDRRARSAGSSAPSGRSSPDDGRLRCVRTWHAGDGRARSSRRSASGSRSRRARGCPGRVLESRRAGVDRRRARGRELPARGRGAARRPARRVRLPAAQPARRGRRDGVLLARAARARRAAARDDGVLGSQVGQFVARRHAEEEVRASESRLRAMLEAALDAVVTMDHRGRVLGWNHAAEAIFGYRADEAIGRDMAELIVPPSLRAAAPRRASRASSRRSAPAILDRRLELTGMHTRRHRVPGRADDHADRAARRRRRSPATCATSPTACAPRQELRASRARLVEVADAERQRIQRNLHDGAQQRLTAVLLDARPARASRRRATGAARPRDRRARGRPPGDPRARERPAPAGALASAASSPRSRRSRCARRSPSSSTRCPTGRLPEPVEAAAYYVVAEALANVHKHAGASASSSRADARRRAVCSSRSPTTASAAPTHEGSGLRGLADRVEALGGHLALESPAGGGTRLAADSVGLAERRLSDTGWRKPAGARPCPWVRLRPQRIREGRSTCSSCSVHAPRTARRRRARPPPRCAAAPAEIADPAGLEWDVLWEALKTQPPDDDSLVLTQELGLDEERSIRSGFERALPATEFSGTRNGRSVALRIGIVPTARGKGMNEVEIETAVAPFRIEARDGRLVFGGRRDARGRGDARRTRPGRADLARPRRRRGAGRDSRPPPGDRSPTRVRLRPLAGGAPGRPPRRLTRANDAGHEGPPAGGPSCFGGAPGRM